MDRRVLKVWYPPEGDFLEVMFQPAEGYFKETDDDRVMEKVDAKGNLLGSSILGVNSLTGTPLEVALQ